MSNEFKVGDSVGVNGKEYKVEAVKGDWLWAFGDESHSGSLLHHERVDKVEPFFVPGKTYRRHVKWSIATQLENVDEVYDVARVDVNGDGRRVAYGRQTVLDGGGIVSERWVVRADFANSRWVEA